MHVTGRNRKVLTFAACCIAIYTALRSLLMVVHLQTISVEHAMSAASYSFVGGAVNMDA